jgi:hypothetical protein
LSHAIGSKEYNLSHHGEGNDRYDENRSSTLAPEEITFTEIKKFISGQSFGEHALEKIKGGSFTQGMKLISLQECHLATLTKSDYHKCLAKFEAKALTKMLYFL